MDFDLSRIDYSISGITYPGTLKLLPSTTPKLQEKIVIGDKTGVLQCLGMKNEEPQVAFKTLPGKEITSVQLAGAPGTMADKIFTASGNEVKGYTRKGKVFLALETNLSETITSMCVSGADLVLGSGSTVAHYRDLQEVNTYICDDRVLDVAVLNAVNSTRIRLVVVVANKSVLLLEQGKTVARQTVSSGPTRLIVPPNDYLSAQEPVIFYGASDGSLGIIAFNGAGPGEAWWRCLVSGRELGAMSCVAWWHHSGCLYLLLGRHDGGVQVFLLDPDNFPDRPKLKYSYFCGETVTSVVGGCVGYPGAAELVVATYSGRIFALRPRDQVPDSQQAVATRLTKLRSEISRLEKQVIVEREKYQLSTQTLTSSGLSAPPVIDLQDQLTGIMADNWQELRLNSAVPLDLLFLYCEHSLEVLTDTTAVLSICPPQDKSSEFLATVRCQADTRRLTLKLRNTRPRHDTTVKLYAVRAGAPRVARLREYKLVALAHYSEQVPLEQAESDRKLSELVVNGAFSVPEMTSWLTGVIPEGLPRPAMKVAFAREHCIISTVLVCQYMKGSATFISDNISTIAILKEVLSKCSVKRNIHVDISTKITGECVFNSYKSVEDMLKSEYQKKQDDYLRKAISELDLNLNSEDESQKNVVCEEYRRVMLAPSSEDSGKHQLLIDIIRDWYTDACTLNLRPCNQSALTGLTEALRSNRLDEVHTILRAVK